MIRVHVICEGQTEEMFVKELLQPVLFHHGIWLVPAIVGKPGHKGGNVKFDRVKMDVENRLLQERTAYCTTFFDFYGLPQSFPGINGLPNSYDVAAKSTAVTTRMVQELTNLIGQEAMRRFIPYVQMYEFEGLLFSDPEAFARSLDMPHLINDLEAISNSFSSPEHINNSPHTAPSKRVGSLIPNYEKPIMGTLAAMEVGLTMMRRKCSLFDAWIGCIESLSPFQDVSRPY